MSCKQLIADCDLQRAATLLVVGLLLALGVVSPGMGLPAAAQSPTPHHESFVIGESVQGQPIEVFRLGTGPRSIVLVGAIHGDEGNSHLLANDLHQAFDGMMHLLPPDSSVYIVPVLNPDGLRVGSRYNVNGVDLNRNWDTPNWQTDTWDASGRVPGGGGPAPFSEPETAAMAGWLLSLRDQSSDVLAVFYHSAYPPNGLVLGGSVGAPTTAAYATIVGYGGGWERGGSGGGGWGAYPVTGMAPGWCYVHGIGCFEVELPSRANLNTDQTRQHVTAVLSVLLWQQTARDQFCFTETGFCVAGRMRTFWESQGGVLRFGMPISRQQQEVIDGVPRQVQWFERHRLELQPERRWPNDVVVGRLGVARLEEQGRNWWLFARENPQQAEGVECQTFPDTGHMACGEILASWRANGLELDGQRGISEAESLALFGMPISPAQTEVLEDGSERVVQWFERARFEIHPQQAPPFSVQFGLLGTELRRATQN